MRAAEFLKTLIDVVNSGQFPDDEPAVVNPGRRAGEDGRYKWSPPLQQHLDSVKDSVGPSDDAQLEEPLDPQHPNYLKSKSIAPITNRPSMPG
jgi:hypothetical protein